MLRILLFLILCCFSQEGLTATRQVPKFIFNAGTYTEFYKKIQINSSGSLNTFDPNPVVGAGFYMPLGADFNFVPEINWVLPQKETPRVMKNIFMTRADFSYSRLDWIRPRLGTSLIWLNQQGLGGSEKINNGNTTSTFYYPDDNRSSLNNTLDAGLELVFFSTLALRLQTYIFSPFVKERRQISYSLFLSYYWDRGPL